VPSRNVKPRTLRGLPLLPRCRVEVEPSRISFSIFLSEEKEEDIDFYDRFRRVYEKTESSGPVGGETEHYSWKQNHDEGEVFFPIPSGCRSLYQSKTNRPSPAPTVG